MTTSAFAETTFRLASNRYSRQHANGSCRASYDEAVERGQALTLREAVAFALDAAATRRCRL